MMAVGWMDIGEIGKRRKAENPVTGYTFGISAF
jgi:hypothetical protein